jgi:hypothetical protein
LSRCLQGVHIVAAEAVREDYRHYIETSFLVRDPSLKARIGRLIAAEKLLWQEAFVSLARPFRSGGRLSDLIDEGVLGPRISRASWGFETIFAHQAAATRRIGSGTAQERNTIVATGTSSGKTEAFLLPIADDCLRYAGERAVRGDRLPDERARQRPAGAVAPPAGRHRCHLWPLQRRHALQRP